MLSVPCEKCDEMMSGKAVVCPHCGARQSDRDPIQPDPAEVAKRDGPFRAAERPAPTGDAPAKPVLTLSPEETRALFASQGLADPEDMPRGVGSLLVPRPGASPFARSLEWTLTLLGLPMLALGLMPFALSWRFRGFLGQASELTLSLASIGLGSFSVWAVVHRMLHLPESVSYAATAVCAGAIVARLFVRLRVS